MRTVRPDNRTRLLTVLTVTGLVVSLAVFNVLVACLRGNNTNHTGFGLWLLALVFLPTLLLGGWASLRGNRRGIGWLACLAGCGGMAFLCYIDYDKILLEYERWTKRGEKPAPLASWPPLSDEELYEFTPISEGVRRASSLTLFEGLPHPMWESDQLETELGSKETILIHDFPFYERPLVVAPDDVEPLRSLCAATGSYSSYMGEKLCGGYHPDYCLRWEDDTETYDLMICFGCGEMKFYGPENYLIADLKAEFETLLLKHRDQRPERK